MASLVSVRINKGDSPNLGFRLQGGKDFATPLVIQKVNPGSPAERAGLVPGDAVIKINNVDVYNLKHKDAQDVVVRAGPAFEMTVQRGGLTWRPSVTPTGHVPAPSPVISNNISPVTRTSLAAPKGDNFGAVGTGHNLSAKPFAPQVNGSLNGGPKLVNKQYNTPVKLYSEDTIAETLAAQSEVLAPGVVGVNFKKNEKNYDASNSAVLRMLKETENEPRTPTEAVSRNFYSSQSHAIGGRRTATPTSEGRSNSVASVRSDNVATSSIRSEQHIATSTTKSENFATSSSNVCETSEQQVGSNVTEEDTVTICTDCERVIVGVFVRIKDKNLHVECFKCSTCGTSLKNVGYYNINNKLYCDIHAKSAALRSNANPNLVPVTVPPGGKPPAHAISSALSTHSLPTPSPLSPKLNNSFASPYQTSNLSGPRPFSSVSGPLSPHNTLPRSTGPISPVAQVPPPSYNTPIHNTPSYSPVSSTGRFSTTKPAGGLFKGAGAGRQAGGVSVAPRRGRGVLNAAALAGARIPLCASCSMQIRGPFITALGKIWCPNHFICATPSCRRPLQDLGFVEEKGQLYCEYCFEKYLAPTCAKCSTKIKTDCLKAIGKNFHPECFNCVYCGKLFGNSSFFIEDGSPYCEADWNELFTTKCFACGFPVEAGDRWVEALNNNYHSQCFNCTMCKKNLEGQSFFAKGGRPFCKNHAR